MHRREGLIVNADDFGRSAGVNAGVLEAHAKGIVTSATVMVLEPSAARGIREAAERAPQLSLGLHFTLTGGGLPSAARGRADARSGRRFPAAAGGHARDPSRRRGAPRARGADRRLPGAREEAPVPPRLPPSRLPPSVGRARRRARSRGSSRFPSAAPPTTLRRLRARPGVRTPDRFIDRFYGESAGFETLADILGGSAGRHDRGHVPPGPRGRGLESASTYAEEREQEIEVLCDPRSGPTRGALGISLVGFEALG